MQKILRTISSNKHLLAAGLMLGAAACSNPFSGGDCVLMGVPAISATVVDANTNKAPSSSPRLRIEDGTFVEDLSTPIPRVDPPTFSGAMERPGVYRVTVSADGYQSFVVEGIAVSRSGKCQYLQGAKLDVKLVPIS